MSTFWTLVLSILTAPNAALAQAADVSDATAPQGPASSEPAAPEAAVDSATSPEMGSPETEEDDGGALSSRYPNKRYIDAVRERASYRALGYGLGRQGEGFVVGVRFDQPIIQSGRAYLQLFHYSNFGISKAPFDPVLMFGANFIVRTEVIMGVFRLYGGGGFHVGFRPKPGCKNPLDTTDVARAYVDEGLPPSPDEPENPSGPYVAVANRIADVEAKCEGQKDPFGISGGGTGGIEFFVSPIRAYFIEVSGGGGTQKNGLWSDAGLILRAGNQFHF